MNNKLQLRNIASKLLVKIYLESDYNLKASVNLKDIVDEYDMQAVQKAGQYLIKKQLVSTNEIPTNTWTAIITYQGIDWLEDWYSNK